MSFNKADALKVASKYVQQGRLQAAIDEYRKLVRAEPHNTTVLNILGDLYYKVGNKTEAIKCFSQLADHYKQQDSSSKAIAILKKALKVEPDRPEIALKLGTLYARENLWGEAEQQFLIAAEQYLQLGQIDEALSIFQRLIEHDPEKTSVRIKLAEAYLRAGQAEFAYQTLLKAANDLQQQGRQEESLKLFLQALKAKPDGREALSSTINIYLQRAETLPAETLIKSLLNVQPEDPELHSLLRRVYQMAHDLKIAKNAISQAVEQDASRVDYQVDLVSASDRACATFLTAAIEHQRQGNHEEALQAYLNALKIKPESQAATSAAVNLHLQQGDTRAAIMLLRHLLRGRPNDAELLSLLAQVYFQAKDYDATEQTIGRALVLNPACYQEVMDLASLWAWNGEAERALRLLDFVTGILREHNEEEKATTLLRDILARDANHLGVLDRLATIYDRTDETALLIATLTTLAQAAMDQADHGAAIKALQRLAQLEPDEVSHQHLLQKLQGERAPASALESMIGLPSSETPLNGLNLELSWEKNSEAEAPAKANSVEVEEPITYFPEYQSLDDFETAINSKDTNHSRPLVRSDQPRKDFRFVPEPAKSVVTEPTITPQSDINLPQPTLPAAVSPLPTQLDWHKLVEASNETEEQTSTFTIEEAETLAIAALPTIQPLVNVAEPAVEDRLAPADASPVNTPTIVISVGLMPTASSSMTRWRRTRPLFRRKEESPLVNPRSRSSVRRRFKRK